MKTGFTLEFLKMALLIVPTMFVVLQYPKPDLALDLGLGFKSMHLIDAFV